MKEGTGYQEISMQNWNNGAQKESRKSFEGAQGLGCTYGVNALQTHGPKSQGSKDLDCDEAANIPTKLSAYQWHWSRHVDKNAIRRTPHHVSPARHDEKFRVVDSRKRRILDNSSCFSAQCSTSESLGCFWNAAQRLDPSM